jgi:Type I phosphodiesterase / nucleotide pyrophosphatase
VSDNVNVTERAVILCLSGAQLADIRDIPEVQVLVKSGAMAELTPVPITGPTGQMYQAFSGRSPASSGFFDTLVPRNYAVVEEFTGRGGKPALLQDLLRTVGWTVQSEEMEMSELVDRLQVWTGDATTSRTCFIARCVARTTVNGQALALVLQIARAWLGETGLLAIVSDTHAAPVERFVNVNNFLAEMGIIERDEQSGQIIWPDSVAYFAGHGQLWINLLGRDRQGVVHPQGEYDEVCASLAKALPQKLLDDGKPVIESVYRKEDLYTSEYLFCLPDLVVVFKPGYAPSPQSTRLSFDAATFTTPGSDVTVDAGVHPSCARGFVLASAPALARGVALPEAAPLSSLVPTLLHALAVEYVDMEELALSELFTPSYLEQHPIRSNTQNQDLSEEDEERIINHLRDLGYV